MAMPLVVEPAMRLRSASSFTPSELVPMTLELAAGASQTPI